MVYTDFSRHMLASVLIILPLGAWLKRTTTLQVRRDATAAVDSREVPRLSSNIQGSHLQDSHDGFGICNPECSNVQTRNCQTLDDIAKQIQDLLADIDAAVVQQSNQGKALMQSVAAAAAEVSSTATAAHPRTARHSGTAATGPCAEPLPTATAPLATARNPQTTTRPSYAKTIPSIHNVETGQTGSTDAALQVPKHADSGLDEPAHSTCTAVAALPPSATDMDDHFCRWQHVARQNQKSGFSAYPPLPYWAAKIAPYPGCQTRTNRTRIWVHY